MRRRAGPFRYLTLALALSIALPGGLPLSPPDDDAPPLAPALSVADRAPRPSIIHRAAHPSRHAPCSFGHDDQTDESDESDEGDDGCPLTPIGVMAAPSDVPLLIPVRLPSPAPRLGRTPVDPGVSCRLRC